MLVVDTTTAFTGVRGRDLEEDIREFPDSCGEHAWQAVAAIESILETCRRIGVPRVFTRGPLVDSMGAMGGWARTKRWRAGRRMETFPDEIRPAGDELVLEKLRPSAFFGTPLAARLMDCGIRSVVVCGGTASGCVRASAVDAFSWGFDVVVVEEATFDRGLVPRAVNLFDIDQKYGNVWSVEDAIAWLEAGAAAAALTVSERNGCGENEEVVGG